MRALVLTIAVLCSGCTAQFAVLPAAKPATQKEVQAALNQVSAMHEKQEKVLEFLLGEVAKLKESKK